MCGRLHSEILHLTGSRNLTQQPQPQHDEFHSFGAAYRLSQACTSAFKAAEGLSKVVPHVLYEVDCDSCLHEARVQRSTTYAPEVVAFAKMPCILTEMLGADNERVSRFQVWPQVASVRSSYPNPMPIVRQQQIETLDPTGARSRLFSREHADSAKVGDVLMVTTKTGEPFAGAFLQIRRRGIDTAIQLRGQLMKTSVEMWFKIYSPTVTAIDIIWRRPKRARRARLTYMRKPKHDMGSVDQLVFAWKKQRYALRSKEKKRTTGKQR